MGFRAVDALSRELDSPLKKPRFKRFLIGKARVNGCSLFLVKPLTFMNRSGEAIHQVLRYADGDVHDLIVVCDSLDLALGACRLRCRGSSAGQKGLQSMIRVLGTQEFLRLSIGIGRPPLRAAVIDYVLGVPPKREQEILEGAVDKAVEGILRLTREKPERVMNDLNQVS